MAPEYTYQIISKTGEGFYKEKGSKFISFVFHVENESQIKLRLDELRKEYFDARHHCYAYILGLQQEVSRANDDGEPGHSAGDPILGQIRSFGLTNTLIVVVRYFGGTKLGVSGLISAYKTAAALAIENTEILQKYILKEIDIEFPYESTNQIMRLVSEFDIEIVSQEYQADCSLKGKVKIPKVEILNKKMKLLQDTGVSLVYRWDGDEN